MIQRLGRAEQKKHEERTEKEEADLVDPIHPRLLGTRSFAAWHTLFTLARVREELVQRGNDEDFSYAPLRPLAFVRAVAL